jgi:hypothetical protein
MVIDAKLEEDRQLGQRGSISDSKPALTSANLLHATPRIVYAVGGSRGHCVARVARQLRAVLSNTGWHIS